MTSKQYVKLYEKWLRNECTISELLVLEEYIDDFNLEEYYWNAKELGSEEEVAHIIYSNFRKRVYKNNVKAISRYVAKIAAVIAFISLGVAIYIHTFKEQSKTKNNTISLNANSNHNKAILTLGDGSKINLEDDSKGIIVNQDGVTVSKDAEGKISYGVLQTTGKNNSAIFNSVYVPKGGEYQIVLPDGTRVWLNSNTKLRYPVAFNEKNRKVELLGEAYFEVAKDKAKPFSVLVAGNEIKVLGTHFNVKAYTEKLNTTLLEGSVVLTNQTNSRVLKPGQSAISISNGNIAISNADIEEVMAWKDGFFVFHDETVLNIMEKLKMWYDIDEVEFEGNIENTKLYGKISKYESLENILKSLELTNVLKFKIEKKGSGLERRVIVMP